MKANPWNEVPMDVTVDWEDVKEAHEAALKAGKKGDTLYVSGSVDLDEALEAATVDQLRDALGRELPGYTDEQLEAIREVFEAVATDRMGLALNLLPRVFEHQAQLSAAERGIRALSRFPNRSVW